MPLLIMAQISPGDLAEAHKHLEGIANCTQCHTLGEKISDQKCLDCHTFIQKLINQQKGYHAHQEVRQAICVSCHSDHHGRKFQMIRFDEYDFDHNKTGYNLQQAHTAAECRDCHQPKYILAQKLKERQNTWLGLGTSCTDCHPDYHQGTLSDKCTDCHSQQDFVSVPHFSHDEAKYVLRGKHLDVACAECHEISVRNGQGFQQFTGLRFANCNACHQDVHDAKFGNNCSSCHSEESFHQIKNLNNFNHDMTNYPLEGRHQQVNCNECHTGDFKRRVAHERCIDCHSDYHQGELMHQEKPQDCDACHSVEGFGHFSFSIERHNQSNFVLDGAHLATPCIACHLQKDDRWHFRQIGIRCNDCHENIHTGIISESYFEQNGCSGCHSTAMWSTISFDHSATGYELLGAHQQQNCQSCHFRKDINGAIQQVFATLSTQCTTCHEDVHKGQFTNDKNTMCSNCHTFSSWNQITFDHSVTRFPLDGKHRNVACAACHITITDGNNSYVKYKFEDIQCEACH
jgi:hypothetical protein